jgi:hypothetical protein
MARGRKPSGPKLVEGLEGSALAKQRLQVILETLAGRCTIEEACEQLGLSPSAFHQLRTRTLADALASLEPRPLGRPPQEASPQDVEIEALQEEVADLRTDLQASRVREEIAVVMPHLLKRERPSSSRKKRVTRKRRSRRSGKKGT